jgi:hypothetical protein
VPKFVSERHEATAGPSHSKLGNGPDSHIEDIATNHDAVEAASDLTDSISSLCSILSVSF